MFKRLLLATVIAAATAGAASAAPITGSFSFQSFGGSFVDSSGNAIDTARTAQGLDFGSASGGAGNGYGTNGSALVGNGTGDFAALNGTVASIADISLGNTANPYTSNPFISFGDNSNIVLTFKDASITRSPTSVTVAGRALFRDGNAADRDAGTFSISADSQEGKRSSFNFTFTGNASAGGTAVPEPVSLALLGSSLAGLGFVRRKQRAV